MFESSFEIENNILKGTEKKIELKTEIIGENLLKTFGNYSDRVAQIDVESGRQTTYKEIGENSVRCALWMQKQNIQAGDVVVVCTNNHLDAYIPCIATFLVGAVYNPWHHEVSPKSAQQLMNLTRPKLIFCCNSVVELLIEVAKIEKIDVQIVTYDTHGSAKCLKAVMREQKDEEIEGYKPRAVTDPKSLAMILFSSGTTGLPKGVAHSYGSLFKNIASLKVFPFDKCVSLWYSSLYWISGTYFMLQTMLVGATRIIHSNFDPDHTCKVIQDYKINWFFITPSMMTHWCKANVLGNYKLDSLKIVLTGGARLSQEILMQLKRSIPHIMLGQAYGMTEIGGIASVQTKECKSMESVGFVVPNVQLKIIDTEGDKILGPNQKGEIFVKSPTAMIGYYRNLAATKATVDKEGWLRTGDIGYYAENGEVFIVDRVKEVMKFRGHHVTSFEIEEVLLSHPDVVEAAVVPSPHELDIERPMAFVKRAVGSKVTEQQLVDLSATLGEYKKLWGGVNFIKDMPYTASGKISRTELKQMAQNLVMKQK